MRYSNFANTLRSRKGQQRERDRGQLQSHLKILVNFQSNFAIWGLRKFQNFGFYFLGLRISPEELELVVCFLSFKTLD